MPNYEDCSETIREQIESALADDDMRIGDVYRLSWLEERDHSDVAEALGLETVSGVYAYLGYINAIWRDMQTSSPSKASQTMSQLSSFLKRNKDSFSLDTQSYIQDSIDYYLKISGNKQAILREGASSLTRIKELKGQNVIYAYSFPHYVQHPHIPNTDGFSDERYMLKIGKTTNDIDKRMSQQTTAMPEDPVLYYVFSTDTSNYNLDDVEKSFHSHLNDIGHRRAESSGGGKEWFLTNFRTIISIAGLLGLKTEYDYEAINDEDNS